MNFLQLSYFKKVAELEHISQAANELYISQPALSKSIHLLEEEVGYPLFTREGTGIRLNENGRILYRYACHILSGYQDALSEISDHNHTNQNVILSMTAGTHFLPEIIMGVKEYFPTIDLAIRQEDYLDKRQRCDLYLHSSTVPLQESNAITLLSEVCLLGVSTDNPLSQETLITPDMLQHETFLTMPDHLPLYQITHAICQDSGFTPDTSLQFDNRETIFDLIKANMGISVIPSKTWAPFIRPGRIVLKPLSVSYYRHIILRWHKDHYLSENTGKIISYLRDYFSALDV